MTRINRSLITSLLDEIGNIGATDFEIENVQWTLTKYMNLLERGSADFAGPIRDAEADLEEILFTQLEGEQRAAVIFRLDALAEELETRLKQAD